MSQSLSVASERANSQGIYIKPPYMWDHRISDTEDFPGGTTLGHGQPTHGDTKNKGDCSRPRVIGRLKVPPNLTLRVVVNP